MFIDELIEKNDKVTLITRPRRFGKTLNLSMLDYFFSIEYSKKEIFQNLKICESKNFKQYNGVYPVIF